MERPSHSLGIWVVVAVLAAAVAMFAWPSGEELAPPSDAKDPVLDEPNEFGGLKPASSSGTFRNAVRRVEQVDAAQTAPQTGGSTASGLPQWSIRLLVVDEQYQPVAGASVAVLLARRETMDRFEPIGTQPQQFRTDTYGRLVQPVESHIASVTVTAEGFDNDAVALLRAEDSNDEVVMLLTRVVTLRGVVRDALGKPLPNAAVAVWESRPGSHRLGRNLPSHDIVADGNGAFEAPVQLGSRHSLRATVGDKKSYLVEALIDRRDPEPITLVMPGGIVVAGVVRDPDGSPAVDGTVYAWRDGHPEERLRTNTYSGKFTLQLPAFEPFFVCGYGHGHASGKPIIVTPALAQPRVEVTLELQELQQLRGRVVDAAGDPIEGAHIEAWCGGMMRQPMEDRPSESARFRDVRGVRSGEDGTFAFAVHPEARWTVEARNHAGPGEATIYGAKGGDELELVLNGPKCAVRGHVTRVGGGEVGACMAGVWRVVLGGAMGGTHPVELDAQGCFDLPPQAVGRDIVVSLVPEDPTLGVHIAGPVRTGAESIQLEFPLRAPGELPVEVVDKDGVAAPFAVVRWSVPHAVGVGVSGHTDRLGRTLLRRCVVGRGTLRVTRWGRVVATREIEVGPGPNRTMFVQL